MLNLLRPAFTLVLIMTLITGLAYPVAITAIAQALFPAQAAGSLVEAGGRVIGSRLIGQQFTAPTYFWGRLSATSPQPYNAAVSVGSNYGPLNPALQDAAHARVEALKNADPDNPAPVPIGLVTSAGSGLDPHISPADAQYQAARVARARGMTPAQIAALIADHTVPRQWAVLGEPTVNVLELNLALDAAR